MDDIRQSLRSQLGQIRAEQTKLGRLVDLLQAALDVVGDVSDSESPPPRTTSTTSTSSPPKPVDPCPHCGRTFVVPQGRSRHVDNCPAAASSEVEKPEPPRDDPPAAAPTTPATTPPPIDGDQDVRGMFFECADCLYRAGNIGRLARHTRIQHGRQLADVERSPVAA